MNSTCLSAVRDDSADLSPFFKVARYLVPKSSPVRQIEFPFRIMFAFACLPVFLFSMLTNELMSFASGELSMLSFMIRQVLASPTWFSSITLVTSRPPAAYVEPQTDSTDKESRVLFSFIVLSLDGNQTAFRCRL